MNARKAAHLLAAAGVPVEVRVGPGQTHVFELGAPAVPEATRSLRQIGDYIARRPGSRFVRPRRWTYADRPARQ